MRSPARRRHLAAAFVLAVMFSGILPTAASAATDPDPAATSSTVDGGAEASGGSVVASGDDWTVERAPAGYLVTLRLATSLPLVDDAPTIDVDGRTLGVARVAADGRTLSVATADERVVAATRVEKGWASGSGAKTGEPDAKEAPSTRRTAPADDDLLNRQLAPLASPQPVADPAAGGPYAVTEAEYDFGDAAIDVAGFSTGRGEMAGKLYLSSARGERPIVVLLHGRHATCGDAATGEAVGGWPCEPGQPTIRSYLGYEETGRALAAHGYDVVSVSANAINAGDSWLSLDEGAQARGRLVLDTLDMLARLDRGETVAFEDRAGDIPVTRTFDQALAHATARADHPAAAAPLSAADLQGRLDLSRVGLMGHSRGGEGVVTAAQLNEFAAQPYGIRAVPPLAPTDFARRTLPDATTAVVLPYCDGDVADQQGQKYVDDSRDAFSDDVARSAVWVMGANHNFFNTVWTPGLYPAGTSDDWPAFDEDSSCATSSSDRLSAAEQYQLGVSYMTGFFRMTLGGEEQFRSLFDGTRSASTTATEFADVRVIATQPRSATTRVTDFVGDDLPLSVEGSGTAEPCQGPWHYVAAACSYREDAQLPHWAPGLLGPATPAYPVTRFTWTGTGASFDQPSDARLRVPLPPGGYDVEDRDRLTLKLAPTDEGYRGIDLDITLVDGSGGEYTVAASSLNPYAVNPLPGGFFLLDKIVLQQVTLPLAQVSGVDLGDLREVRLTPVVGADGSVSGGVYLSDLAFDTPAAGTATPSGRVGVNMAPTRVDEGDVEATVAVAVWLDRASDAAVSAFVNTGQAVDSPVAVEATRVTFAPGQTCIAVPVRVNGDDVASGAAGIRVTTSATTSAGGGLTGTEGFSTVEVREDDGPPLEGEPLPPFGVQGDVCAESVAARTPGVLQISEGPWHPGGTVRLTATGYRFGEAVTAVVGSMPLPPVIAGADGMAVLDVTLPIDAAPGDLAVRTEGAGSARVQEAIAVVGPAPSPSPSPDASSSVTPPPQVPVTAPALSGTLARTGVDGANGLAAVLLGALLAAGGTGAIVHSSRRRRMREQQDGSPESHG